LLSKKYNIFIDYISNTENIKWINVNLAIPKYWERAGNTKMSNKNPPTPAPLITESFFHIGGPLIKV